MPSTAAGRKPARSAALKDYRRLITLLSDRVRSVARGFQTGAYIVGRPGAGKTHTVRRVLEACEADHVFLNARNERINVIYRRDDGSYGLIEPRTG